ncbi:hypothetical protein [Halobacillus naozhouensis]|uniref:Uncharacterized protein n=1 Tax=Halobacillus naozhouensis TaxID=554880 RepID=A0ABY8IZU9_9BACI|nr:hypothetical protein [Halobacillus naozhouensis]WFT74892.1 hypothetical protein P9989_00180 [Halobacillus naozhouensis]
MNKRRFKAFRIKGESETGIGIAEHVGKESIYIASLYYDRQLSHRDIFCAVGGHVYGLLEDDDNAHIRLCDFQMKKSFKAAFPERVYFRTQSYHESFSEPKLLAEDSIQRRISITEVLCGKEEV